MNDDKLDGRLVQGIPSNCLVVNRQVAESSNALPASLEEVPNTLPEAQKESEQRACTSPAGCLVLRSIPSTNAFPFRLFETARSRYTAEIRVHRITRDKHFSEEDRI